MRIGFGSQSVRNFSANMRAAGLRGFLCAAVMATLLASSASPQYLEAVIKLPDTLGPLNGPYHLAWDENPARPRLYIGGEADSGGVIVAEALTCKRLARISTGPAKALCFVSPHGKLYVARLGVDSVAVVDCATNRVISSIHAASVVPVMQYNAQNDRLYCGGSSVTVVDCAADTVVHTIAVAASSFAYDSAVCKLYAGRNGPLTVIDCASDSVVATIPEVGSATALCFNPTPRKVYAVTTNTLFAVRADDDSVVARIAFDSLGPLLACDPQRNRIYCTHSHRDYGHWTSIDCSADTVLRTRTTQLPITFLACNTARDMLYVFFRTYYDEVDMYDATTGELLTHVMVDGVPPGGGWSPSLDRLYCLPSRLINGDPGYSCCLLSAIDGTGDSVAGIVPLTMKAGSIVLDTMRNRLYFGYGLSACGCVGVVDCARNVVTSYAYAGEEPTALCFNPNSNRLYWSTAAWGGHGNSMTVYDCSTNAVVGKVITNNEVRITRLHPSLNKLYAYAYDPAGSRYAIDVIDCEQDSVIKVLYLPDHGGGVHELLLVLEDNMLWCLGTWSVVAIDCLGDSIVATARDTLGTLDDAIACTEDRRIYAAGVTARLRSIDMDNPVQIDTLHEWISYGSGMRFVNVPAAHKAYWTVNNSGVSTHFFSIDTRDNTLVDSFWLNRTLTDMCLDHTGNYVYCAAQFDSALFVIDSRVDSVVATLRLPPSNAAEKNSLVMNRATNRIYIAQYDYYRYGDEIPVIRDSMLIGVEELAPASPSRFVGPTVVSRGAPVRVSEVGELWDATGRRAAVLRSGPNDISLLAPGVYFIRQGLGTRGEGLGETRKIVLTE